MFQKKPSIIILDLYHKFFLKGFLKFVWIFLLQYYEIYWAELDSTESGGPTSGLTYLAYCFRARPAQSSKSNLVKLGWLDWWLNRLGPSLSYF